MMVFDALGYYAVLESNYYTDEHTLKMKFRQKAKFWHPDMNKDKSAVEMFQKISKAYDVLKDAKTKTVYTLLSMVYEMKDFPNMKNLKSYKAVNGDETPFLRVMKINTIKNRKLTEENLIGTLKDMKNMLKDVTQNNLKHGLLSGLFIKALRKNLQNTTLNGQDNLKLLVHNAAVYFYENKVDEALSSAAGALEFATGEAKNFLNLFIKENAKGAVKTQKWNTSELKKIQHDVLQKIYKIFWFVLVFVVLILLLSSIEFGQKEENYYRQVKQYEGGTMVDDILSAKVFNIPVDVTDENMLYHITSAQELMHGPSENFDVMTSSKKGQTVRVSGYTPDKVWFRVMLDNGEMGFIKGKYLKKGIGLEIPEGSKIIPEAQTF